MPSRDGVAGTARDNVCVHSSSSEERTVCLPSCEAPGIAGQQALRELDAAEATGQRRHADRLGRSAGLGDRRTYHRLDHLLQRLVIIGLTTVVVGIRVTLYIRSRPPDHTRLNSAKVDFIEVRRRRPARRPESAHGRGSDGHRPTRLGDVVLGLVIWGPSHLSSARRLGLKAMGSAIFLIFLCGAAGEISLLEEFPGVTLVINHSGVLLDRTEETPSGWRAALAAMADHPNVAIKASGLCVQGRPWTVDLN